MSVLYESTDRFETKPKLKFSKSISHHTTYLNFEVADLSKFRGVLHFSRRGNGSINQQIKKKV